MNRAITFDLIRSTINTPELRTFSASELEEALLLMNRNLASEHFQQGQYETLRDSIKTLLALRTNADAIRKANLKSWLAIVISVVAIIVTVTINRASLIPLLPQSIAHMSVENSPSKPTPVPSARRA